MALKATVCKAALAVSDIRRHYYADHALTLARHPSETDERMMLRLVAFALNADEALTFTRGLCADDEPDLWRKALTGDIEHWIDVGRPSAERLRKASRRAARVSVYTLAGRQADVWWRQTAEAVRAYGNLEVIQLGEAEPGGLAALAGRNMVLQCTVDGDNAWLTDGRDSVALSLATLR